MFKIGADYVKFTLDKVKSSDMCEKSKVIFLHTVSQIGLNIGDLH